MATSNTLRASAADQDLRGRAIAIVEAAGRQSAAVSTNMGALVALRGIADAYESAQVARDAHIAAAPPPVGANLAAVTDDMLRAALGTLGLIDYTPPPEPQPEVPMEDVVPPVETPPEETPAEEPPAAQVAEEPDEATVDEPEVEVPIDEPDQEPADDPEADDGGSDIDPPTE